MFSSTAPSRSWEGAFFADKYKKADPAKNLDKIVIYIVLFGIFFVILVARVPLAHNII